jgi:ketosteroid isomerase-like protein
MLIPDLLRLWNDPPQDPDAGEAAFAALYCDPVVINGAPVTAADLASSARSLAAAIANVERDVVEVVEAGDRLVVEFRVRGTHAASLPTRLGAVSATGAEIDVRVIDIFTLADGRISHVSALMDELGLLLQLDAVGLASRA